MAQRISEWIPLRDDRQGANVYVLPWSKRPDLASFAQANVVYEIQDLWTTRDGSWDNSSGQFNVPQWARDTYLKPWGDPNIVGAGGAATHILLSCKDQAGAWQIGKGVVFVTGAPDPAQSLDLSKWSVQKIPNDRWYVIEMQKSSVYFPNQGQRGPWCLATVGLSDVVVGVGLPYSWHVSTFGVWQEKPRTDGGGGGGGGRGDGGGGGGGGGTSGTTDLAQLIALQKEANALLAEIREALKAGSKQP